MDAVKFIEERDRMCKSFNNSCNLCKGCPAFNVYCTVSIASTLDAAEQVAMVEKWSTTLKTRNSEFLKRYPNADVYESGIANICPKCIDKSYNPSAGCCDTNCYDCKTKYWTQEVE